MGESPTEDLQGIPSPAFLYGESVRDRLTGHVFTVDASWFIPQFNNWAHKGKEGTLFISESDLEFAE